MPSTLYNYILIWNSSLSLTSLRRRKKKRKEKKDQEYRLSPKFAQEKKKSDLICVGHPSDNELYLTGAEFTSV